MFKRRLFLTTLNTWYCYLAGPIEKVFNNRLVTPLGRLSYAVYLVNIQVMMVIENRQSSSISPSIENWVSSQYLALSLKKQYKYLQP